MNDRPHILAQFIEIGTFMPPVAGFALGARLIPILPLILIAGPADGKRTDMTRNEWFTIHCFPNIIATDLADLGPQGCLWLCLKI